MRKNIIALVLALALCLEKQNRTAEGFSCCQKACELCERLAETRPEYGSKLELLRKTCLRMKRTE